MATEYDISVTTVFVAGIILTNALVAGRSYGQTHRSKYGTDLQQAGNVHLLNDFILRLNNYIIYDFESIHFHSLYFTCTHRLGDKHYDYYYDHGDGNYYYYYKVRR